MKRLMCQVPSDKTIVTVALEEKWYGLFLLHPSGNVEPIPFPMDVETTPPFRDHVPNPDAVQEWADKRGYYLDELSYELMVGRWEVEGWTWNPPGEP